MDLMRMQGSPVRRIALVSLGSAVAGCGSALTTVHDAGTSGGLHADSAEYTVRYTRPLYQASIGYVLTNGTATTVSANYCREPGPPALEKHVEGRWVPAYSPVILLCQTIPPFRLAPGATYRGRLALTVAAPGLNVEPRLLVESIGGTYRLHWVFQAGPDPDHPHAEPVEFLSGTFRLVDPNPSLVVPNRSIR